MPIGIFIPKSCKVPVGTKVIALKNVARLPYVQKRRKYLNIREGAIGRVVRVSNTGKIGIDFDEPIFNYAEYNPPFNNNGVSSIDQACHGAGREGHSIYLPFTHIAVLDINPEGGIPKTLIAGNLKSTIMIMSALIQSKLCDTQMLASIAETIHDFDSDDTYPDFEVDEVDSNLILLL